MPELPTLFLRRMQGFLGQEYPAYLDCLRQAPTAGLRVNTLKVSPTEFAGIAPFSLEPIPWCPEGFWLGNPDKHGKHPYHAAGLYYLQDPSAMAVTLALDPRPGEKILDLAAAPGGKATHIASRLGGQGLLVANEIHPQRAWELAQNLERWGVQNTVITREAPKRLAVALSGFFDKVLLDAPCSGEGMFRKSEAARRDWSVVAVQSCALRQAAILEQAGRLVRPGGGLVYSTCTFSPEENEGVVAEFLRRHPEFELAPIAAIPGAASGRPDWLPDQTISPALELTLRLWPQHGMGEGHFIARMQKDSPISPRSPGARQPPRLPAQAEQLFQAFINQALDMQAERLTPEVYGVYLYQVPADYPQVHGLRVVHPGWWLGTLKTNRFEPAHALALALRPDQARQVIDLHAEDASLLAYLRGEPVRGSAHSGWVLVLVDGYPLGWGKSSRGEVKNYYPKGLRWS